MVCCLHAGNHLGHQSLDFEILDRYPVGAAISTAVVFDSARRLAYATTLEGRLLAFQNPTLSALEQPSMHPDDPIAPADLPEVVLTGAHAHERAAAGPMPEQLAQKAGQGLKRHMPAEDVKRGLLWQGLMSRMPPSMTPIVKVQRRSVRQGS